MNSQLFKNLNKRAVIPHMGLRSLMQVCKEALISFLIQDPLFICSFNTKLLAHSASAQAIQMLAQQLGAPLVASLKSD